jgi:hypothetical protein
MAERIVFVMDLDDELNAPSLKYETHPRSRCTRTHARRILMCYSLHASLPLARHRRAVRWR